VSEHDLRQFVKANFAVIIISDTRDEKTDESGKIAKEQIIHAGHEIKAYQIIRNDKAQIRNTVKELLKNPELNVILTSGGTGISKRDITTDTLTELFDKKIEGFGELFRKLSYEEIGEAAMISRATAGAVNGKLVFCLPGSKNAVKLALTKLILPGLGHMIKEANR
jgi:molybdenum cofactor biosynthesis protein B